MLQQTLTPDDFSEQCWIILNRMLNGERITMKTAIDTGIGDIRRRAKDLIDFQKIPVRRERAFRDGRLQRYKWYFIDEDDRAAILKKLAA